MQVLKTNTYIKVRKFPNEYCTRATHLANFDEKVHKLQSKSYCRIGANAHLIFTHIL